MKSAHVVIGANLGDEAKGLVTDFLSSQQADNVLVLRFNGGAQASHTVVTPDGRRHAFSHFSSGSFAGAATFLSRFFTCNPLLFVKEQQKLQGLGVEPVVYVDGQSPVTTPYDMMLNQMCEEARGNARHGSCGLGYGETIERHMHSPYPITYADLADTKRLTERLQLIRDTWVPARLNALGMGAPSETWQSRIDSEGVLQKFLSDTQTFLSSTTRAPEHFLRDTGKAIIFEGAQGLLLDQDHAWFPHVTRSHTGLRNVSILAKEAHIGALKVVYATRTYLTRHGAGPLPHELHRLPYPRIVDETNIPNDYQGALRFAWLDLDLLARTIAHDLTHADPAIAVEHGIAVSCMDQVDGRFTFIRDNAEHTTDEQGFLEAVRETMRPRFMLTSHGPSRGDVRSF